MSVISVGPKFSITQETMTLNIYHVNKGEGIPRHEHMYSHLTCCHSGSILVTKENVQKVMTKNSTPVNLKPGEWHEIEALEDNTVFVNVFATQFT